MATGPTCCRTMTGRSWKAIRFRPVSITRGSGRSTAGCTTPAGPNTWLEAFQLSCEKEGIIPALEPCHALAHVMKIAPELPADHIICMNMCGRGDKDIFTVAKHLGFGMDEDD